VPNVVSTTGRYLTFGCIVRPRELAQTIIQECAGPSLKWNYGTGPGQGTLPQSINPAGAITGYYTDASGLSHGFVRAPDGAITTFDDALRRPFSIRQR
jgi:hypothetical protein